MVAAGRALGAEAWGRRGASAGQRRGPLSSQGHNAWCGGGWHSTDAAGAGGGTPRSSLRRRCVSKLQPPGSSQQTCTLWTFGK